MTTFVPRLTQDGSRTLYCERFAQSCHSDMGALGEVRHVSLELAGVAARLREGRATRVLEVGFGTGLACLATLDLARSHGTRLDYVALEIQPLEGELLRSLGFAAHLEHPGLVEELARALDAGRAGFTAAFAPSSRVELRVGDAREIALEEGAFDACYFDPFRPDANPELWERGFLSRVVASLRPGGVLSSYCVRGAVRRTLGELGMEVTKRAGFGRKREALQAVKRAAHPGPEGAR